MATDQSSEYQPTYRQQNVDETLNEHDRRISNNERRWLIAKGAMAMLAANEGINFAAGQLSSFI